MTKRKIFFVLILLLLVAGYALGSRRLELSEAASRRKEPAQSYTVSSAPTLFFHGWGSGSFTENQMVRYMERQGITSCRYPRGRHAFGQGASARPAAEASPQSHRESQLSQFPAK